MFDSTQTDPTSFLLQPIRKLVSYHDLACMSIQPDKKFTFQSVEVYYTYVQCAPYHVLYIVVCNNDQWSASKSFDAVILYYTVCYTGTVKKMSERQTKVGNQECLNVLMLLKTFQNLNITCKLGTC